MKYLSLRMTFYTHATQNNAYRNMFINHCCVASESLLTYDLVNSRMNPSVDWKVVVTERAARILPLCI